MSANGGSKKHDAVEGLIRPFAGLRPPPERAADVIAVPYDVLTAEEARGQVRERPWSFLHISRPEVDLSSDSDPFSAEAYETAGATMRRFVDAGILERDPAPSYYIYRLKKGSHEQTGVAAAAALAAYEDGRIRRHELTRPKKVDDRARQIEAVGAQTGPVLVAHRPLAELTDFYDTVTARPPDCSIDAPDGVTHALWQVSESVAIERLTALLAGVKALYIADGHHRSAAAAKVAAERRQANPRPTGEAAHDVLLIVAFPSDELRILDYNRVVRDLGTLGEADYLDRVGVAFTVMHEEAPVRPSRPREFGMYVGGRWYRLGAREAPPADASPVERLDISILSRTLFEPILGIGDSTEDSRIEFVGGHRGLQGLQSLVDGGEMAVAFSLYPTSMEDLMAVADAGEVMPPKSTWFDPKLADGLVSYPLD